MARFCFSIALRAQSIHSTCGGMLCPHKPYLLLNVWSIILSFIVSRAHNASRDVLQFRQYGGNSTTFRRFCRWISYDTQEVGMTKRGFGCCRGAARERSDRGAESARAAARRGAGGAEMTL